MNTDKNGRAPPSQPEIRNLKSSPLVLPNEFKRQLDNTAAGSACDTAECAAADSLVRIGEIHLVERVEKLAAELQLPGFPDRKILEGREIRAGEGRPADQSAAGIAINSARQEARLNESAGILYCECAESF